MTDKNIKQFPTEQYLKVTYAPDNGYEFRNSTVFKKRRLNSKKKKRKDFIISGHITYFMSNTEKENFNQKILSNCIVFKNPGKLIIESE